MTRACPACGSHLCDGVQCYLADPADYAQDEETTSTITLDELRQRYALTETVGDPLLKAKRRHAA